MTRLLNLLSSLGYWIRVLVVSLNRTLRNLFQRQVPISMSDPDSETLQLITSLLREDVERLSKNSKGKYASSSSANTSVKHDNEIAIHLFSQYLREAQTVQEDRRFAESFAKAVETDQELLLEFYRDELVERDDHEIALRLSGCGIARRETSDERLRWLDREGTARAGSSKAGPSLTRVPTPCPKPDICAICMEKQTATYRVSCGHNICVSCLTHLYRHASEDEAMVPVRCCRIPIDDNLARSVIDPTVYKRYQTRKQETQCSVKLYCPKNKCGSFIPATKDDQREKAIKICPSCRELVCAGCRSAQHEGKCVDKSELADRLFAERVSVEKWKTCYSCKRVVERTQGCPHMTCRCGSQFCYLCGKKWKTCGCP